MAAPEPPPAQQGPEPASSCTPTTLYSTAFVFHTTNLITQSSTQTPIPTHSTKQVLRTVCAAPPGIEMHGCQKPFVQTDNVDVLGSLTWVTVDVTRIETVTETKIEGVKTVPCGRGLVDGDRAGETVGTSTSAVVESGVVQSSMSVSWSVLVQTSSQALQAQATPSQPVASSSSPAAASSPPTSTFSTTASDPGSSSEPPIDAQATITSTRYHEASASSNSATPLAAASSTASNGSTGQIVGIVFGVLVGLMIVGVAIAGLRHWWRKRDKDEVVSIDDEEILAWRRAAKEEGRESWQDQALGNKIRSKHQSTTPSFISTVSRLAHLARKPYNSPLLKSAPTYGGTATRSRRNSHSTLGGRSNRLSQGDLGSLVQHHSEDGGPVIPMPPLPPRVPPLPFKARPPSSNMTVSSFGGDVEALDENENGARDRRLTHWNPGRATSAVGTSHGRQNGRSRPNDEAYGGVGG